jgi:hypothetical protein
MGTITKMVPQGMERLRQKQMKLNKLTQPELEDSAEYFSKRDNMHNTSHARVVAVVQL